MEGPLGGDEILEVHSLLESVHRQFEKRVVGQKRVIDRLLMGMLVSGHVLVEGVPGLAKTRIVKTMADLLDAGYRRIQFTPDLLPADLTGSMVYRPQTGEFVARKGPIFTNIVLADEINRAPAKVQSALLQAMEERQVTIGETTYELEDPFFVLATQNPIEQEGTYPLPESELDRFALKLLIDYPSFDEELAVLRLIGDSAGAVVDPPVDKVLHPPLLLRMRTIASRVKMDDKIERYIVAISEATRREKKALDFGVSPRGSLYLYRCAKVQALFCGRGYVLPEDVKDLCPDVFRHRLVLSYEAESEDRRPEDVIEAILSSVRVP